MLVVGLGNPGEEYARTRHNVGFMVADELAGRWNIRWRSWKRLAETGKGIVHGLPVILAKPLTFMNRSGSAVRLLLEYFQLAPRDLVAVSDEVHLPLGSIRLRRKGSDGGHHGLASLIESLGTSGFPRLRIGVGRAGEEPPADFAPYVLGRFTAGELPLVKEMVGQAASTVECLIEEGIETAMARFNG